MNENRLFVKNAYKLGMYVKRNLWDPNLLRIKDTK